MVSACVKVQEIEIIPPLENIPEQRLEDKASENVELSSSTATASNVHSIFTKHQKRYIIFIASWGALFSSMSIQIYYPSLNSLVHDLDVSNGLINLTVMSYMIFQGLSPMFIGDFADKTGRRPAYLLCFTIYIVANIGLALQTNYAALFILRCVQSTGISSTVALASGVVSDIATPEERGSYLGISMVGLLMGPMIGPIIGGVLAQYLGWRAIFWFLVIFAGTFTVQLLLFVPETARKIVGNGSIPPPVWNRPLINLHRTSESQANTTQPNRQKLTFPNPLRTLSIAFHKETSAVLFVNGMLFIAIFDVSAAIPSIYKDLYDLNSLQIGLCYIPFGVGAAVSSMTTGKLLDWNYRRMANKLNISTEGKRVRDIEGFPIEKARLQLVFPLVIVGGLSIFAFGWLLHFRTHIAAPTTILFLIGGCLTGASGSINTLIVDLYPDNAAAATASNNLVRCLLGAGATALIDPMLNAMGRGWCFTLIAFVVLSSGGLASAIIAFGPKWRRGG
ncbi:major facilitator superfamily domain-containing protein [Aspergillus avenaceus]|uniref:Citrate exporter 1 n=1 Tax=Aspergillus avenaceus TaxID=36643 RepID=A0A5N6U3Y4_ASPAV|nr:major facilitator superfamily domain-containing protein [Aspergillus avenaceus]